MSDLQVYASYIEETLNQIDYASLCKTKQQIKKKLSLYGKPAVDPPACPKCKCKRKN